jgi:hypothetical protein
MLNHVALNPTCFQIQCTKDARLCTTIEKVSELLRRSALEEVSGFSGLCSLIRPDATLAMAPISRRLLVKLQLYGVFLLFIEAILESRYEEYAEHAVRANKKVNFQSVYL